MRSLRHTIGAPLAITAALVSWGPMFAAAPAAKAPSSSTARKTAAMGIEKTSFGKTAEGQAIDLYVITNRHGLVLKLTNYGAIVVALETPDRHGKLANINVGFAKLDDYFQKPPYFGATVGRYANRIALGKFAIDGNAYTLATNNGPNHLHGGLKGFDKVVWHAEEVQGEGTQGVKFAYTSPDGEEGYPGNLKTTATYTLTDANELRVELTAVTDKPTVVNLTNHNYWNLAGVGSGKVYDQEMQIFADKYVIPNEALIPTGELGAVAGTPLDFTAPRKIGENIQKTGGDPVGYDHCYVLRNQDQTQLAPAARVKDSHSGRVMEISTTQPGIQFYSGNFLDGTASCAGLKQHEAFCLETQHYPDAPNQPKFPSTELRPGQTYKQITVHKFSVE